MLNQVLHWALAGHDGLHEEAKHGEHGEAAVLDLLHLELSQGVGVLGQAQGVKVLPTWWGRGGGGQCAGK